MEKENAQWIWLDSSQYPEFQTNQQQILWPKTGKDCVVDFQNKIDFLRIPKKVTLYVSGDAVFRLWANGEFVGQGPASAGGDFLLNVANIYVIMIMS